EVEKLKTGGNYTIKVSLLNIGQQAASQVNVKLRSNNPFVFLQNGNLQIQSINGLTEYTILNQIQVHVSSQVPYGTVAEFTLKIEDGEETRYFYFEVPVAAPSLFTGDLLVDDHASGGNNNGIIDYGERVHLIVPAENFGDAPAEPGFIKMESLRNYLNVYRALNPIGELLPQQVVNSTIDVSVKPSVYQPCADLVRITYYSGMYSYQRVYEVGIAGGTSSIDEVTADQLLIYPNPTSDQLNLVLSEQRMEGDLNYVICNAVGAVVSRGTILDTRTTINVESLTTGFYFIQILQNNYLILNQKIIKK
ncbi:MAG TPA: T9SS type A sorting domain-containing protein, partial [Bacteroidales bacterium]|nr:T9SS type A sorting domain-containing protein [Bacteroidales bacterium]